MKAKRFTAFMLCLMLLVSLVPSAVFADETETEEIVEVVFDETAAQEPADEIIEEEENASGLPVEDGETVEDEEPAEEEQPLEDEEIPAEEDDYISGEEDEIPEEPEIEDEDAEEDGEEDEDGPEEIDLSIPRSMHHVNPIYKNLLGSDYAREYFPREDEGLNNVFEANYVDYNTAAKNILYYYQRKTPSFSVYIKMPIDADIWLDFYNIEAQASQHTGNSVNGDYIAYQYGSFDVDVDGYYDNNYYYLQWTVYNIDYYTTAAQEDAVTGKVNQIISQLGLNANGVSNYEKICRIYDYLCGHISYDYAHLGDDSYKLQFTAYGALCQNTAVCQGIAVAFYRLCLASGVSGVRVVTSDPMCHAWNIVDPLNNGKYYFVDATWDLWENGHSANNYDWFLRGQNYYSSHHTVGGVSEMGNVTPYQYVPVEYEGELVAVPVATRANAAYLIDTNDFSSDDGIIASGMCGENVSWELNKDYVLTVKGSGAMYEDCKSCLSKYNTMIKKAVIENGVTSIGNNFFYGCFNMTSAALSADIKSIGDYAFYSCRVLVSIKMPNGVESIGFRAFYDCRTVTSVVIPGKITEIGDYAFERCSNLASVTFSKGAACIGAYMFSGCYNLVTVTIPESVKSIGEHAFGGCSALTEVIIPDSVTDIGAGAFARCSKLANVKLPAGLTTVSDNLFYFCHSLTSVDIPVGVSKIGSSAFEGCGITQLTIPEGVTSIGEKAFVECKFETLILPDAVTSIGEYAFSACTNLKAFTIPSGVTSISPFTFEKCVALETVSIPDTVTSIGKSAFSHCEKLAEVDIPYGVTSLNCTFEFCRSLKSVTVPESVTVIVGTFGQCTALESVVLHDGLTSISGSFSGCTALKKLQLPQYLTDLGYGTFYFSGITELVIPKSVTKIGSSVFSGSAIKKIVFLGDGPSIDKYAFQQVTATAYYPGDNSTWTNTVMQNYYEGNITWVKSIPVPEVKTAPVLQTPANHENFMIIQWSKVEGAMGYRLQYREGSGPWTEVNVALTQVNSKGEPRWDYRNAKDGATYTFRVFADFSDGTSTESNRMGQMRLRTPKITVSRFGTANEAGGFRINWEATTGGSQYKIYYREKGGSWTLYTMMPKSSNTTFLNIKASVISANPNMPNLVAGHTYEFMVLTCTTVASVTSGYPTPFVSMVY